MAGAGLGYAGGGRLSELIGRFHAVWLLWLAVGVQLVHNESSGARRFVADHLGVSMLVVVFGVGLVWMAINLWRWEPAMRYAGAVVLIGAMANFSAMAANGRMPYSAGAAATAGVPLGATTPKNEPAGRHTRLALLADNLPIAPLHKIVSVGDVLIGAGTVALLAAAMRRRNAGDEKREEVTCEA